MPICKTCGYDIAQCQCKTDAEDIFFAVDSTHRHYNAEETDPEKDDFFKEEDSFEEGCDFDYLDFNNDWED